MPYIELGPVPYEEECQQVGTPGYNPTEAWAEMRRYKCLLEERFPLPEGADGWFAIKSFPHDFGAYHEVCAYYNNAAGEAWAYHCDAHLPATWDDRQVLPLYPVNAGNGQGP